MALWDQDSVNLDLNLIGQFSLIFLTWISEFRKKYIYGADPIGADPASAHSTGADSTGADPTGAYSIGADSTGADPTGADLTGAHSTSADSTGADSPVSARA